MDFQQYLLSSQLCDICKSDFLHAVDIHEIHSKFNFQTYYIFSGRNPDRWRAEGGMAGTRVRIQCGTYRRVKVEDGI